MARAPRAGRPTARIRPRPARQASGKRAAGQEGVWPGRRRYGAVMNSLARSLSAACCRLWARCRRWLRMADSRGVRAEGAASSCVRAAPSRAADEAAARAPRCSDQLRACCLDTSVSLRGFIALAFAEMRGDRSPSLVTGRSCSRKATAWRPPIDRRLAGRGWPGRGNQPFTNPCRCVPVTQSSGL
jgi:hypothetical protein